MPNGRNNPISAHQIKFYQIFFFMPKDFFDQNIITHKLNLATHWMPSRELS